MFVFSLAGGCKHRGPWAGSAGAPVQGLQTCYRKTGRHPRTAEQTQTGKTSSHILILVNIWWNFILKLSCWKMLVIIILEMFPCCPPGSGLLCGDEVGIHQLGWVSCEGVFRGQFQHQQQVDSSQTVSCIQIQLLFASRFVPILLPVPGLKK